MSLPTVLNFVFKGNHDKFCCLCYSIDKNLSLHRELGMQINETGQNKVVTEVLQSIFGNEINEYLTVFGNICDDCLKSVINVYTFIQTSQDNIMLLMNAVDSLSNSFDYLKNVNADSKSLYMSLNTGNYTTKHIYDNKMPDTAKAALKRYKFLNLPKMKEVLTIKKETSQKKSNIKGTVNIKVSDMLLDSKDQFEHQCKLCFKSYLSMWNLKNHYYRVHAPKNYKCPKCPKLFGSPSIVAYHLSENHCGIVCSECGKSFQNRTTLSRHEMAHHLQFVCTNCGRTYKNKITFKKHLDLKVCKQESRASPANAQLTCDYCGKKYTQKTTLRVHIQYEHGNYKAHACEWCGKKFWAQSRLKAHIVKHTKEKNFTCSICQGKFVTKESLLYHTRLHTGEKPYKCSECDCTFISSSRRAYHLKTYHLIASVECEICHSKFASRSYLFKHMKCHKQTKNEKNVDVETKKQGSNETDIIDPEIESMKRAVKNMNSYLVSTSEADDQQVDIQNQSIYPIHSSNNYYIKSES